MPSGIRAEIKVDDPGDCEIAAVSAENHSSSRSVSKATYPESPVVTEDVMFDSDRTDEETNLDMEPVFSYGSKKVYRFEREKGRGCACEQVEKHGCPIVEVYTHNGSLFLTFHAEDVETLKATVADLRERYADSDVGVERLIRSDSSSSEDQMVFVDRSELTERQQEVLETAHEMGYFEHPKGANAGEVAEELGITTSTFTEHLSSAQKKIMNSILRA
ncbi:MAG: helix-turn-helix domain-containing protein [Halobacteria archaeon]|nr:helix-turn-helix domain-containing protein [Halobacteria archaeon]